LPKCVTEPNFAVIGQTVAEIWQFVDFSRAVAAILHLYIFEILSVGRVKRVKVRRCAKLGGDQLSRG